jgi:hypothetical protein
MEPATSLRGRRVRARAAHVTRGKQPGRLAEGSPGELLVLLVGSEPT